MAINCYVVHQIHTNWNTLIAEDKSAVLLVSTIMAGVPMPNASVEWVHGSVFAGRDCYDGLIPKTSVVLLPALWLAVILF